MFLKTNNYNFFKRNYKKIPFRDEKYLTTGIGEIFEIIRELSILFLSINLKI